MTVTLAQLKAAAEAAEAAYDAARATGTKAEQSRAATRWVHARFAFTREQSDRLAAAA